MMMNMGEKITEEECEFLVDVSEDGIHCRYMYVNDDFRRLTWMEMAASILRSLLA